MDIFGIVTLLLPILAQVFKGCAPTPAGPQTPQEFLADRFDATTGKFDDQFVESLRPHTRHAARKNGSRLHGHEEIDKVTIAALEHARLASHDEVTAVMAAAPDLTEDMMPAAAPTAAVA